MPNELVKKPEAAIDESRSFALLDEAYEEGLKKKAREHTDDSITTLVELRDGDDTPPQTRRACANDIIEHGHARQKSAKNPLAGIVGAGGIHITVVQFGEPENPLVREFSEGVIELTQEAVKQTPAEDDEEPDSAE